MSEALDTKERILESARALFEENNYHEISMSAIAEKADIGKGTLYWHFSSKDELFNEMISREGSKVLVELQTLHQSNITAKETLKMFIRGALKCKKNQDSIRRIFISNDIKFMKRFEDSLFKIFYAIVDEVENIIKKGIDSGVFMTESPRKIALAILGIVHSLDTNIMDEEGFDEDELVEFAYNFILKGIDNRKELESSE